LTVLEPFPGTRVIPIGGVGEFGANATVIQTPGATVLVDFGIMFPPNQRQPGVDFYINDPQLLLDQFPELSAVFITHAHEDHIGGVPFLLKHADLEVYATPYAAHILRIAMEGAPQPHVTRVRLNQPVVHGDLSVEYIGMTHSIAEACALCVETPHGRIVHTGDFKVDPLPGDDWPFQSERLGQLGEEGVDLLIMDSTNATKRGFCPPELEIEPYLDRIVAEADGRVLFTTFSSHIPRLRRLIHIARRHGRKIALVGRSFHKHFHAALDTGNLAYQPGAFVELEAALDMPDDEVLFVIAGSQGEAQSSLTRVAGEGVKGLRVHAGDHVVFSSKAIPGNERLIALLASDFERKGATVHTERTAFIHTSGHGFREDLAYMLSLVRPRTVVPIHGEFHQLLEHFHWLKALIDEDQSVMLIEDGDILAMVDGEVDVAGVAATGMTPIDGNQLAPLSPEILRDRKNMMYSGLILISGQIPVRGDKGAFDIAAHGLAESEPGRVIAAIHGALRRLRFSQALTEPQWAEAIFRETKSALRPVFSGRPLIKVTLNGRILV